jgi:hypothetical protein
MIEFCYIVPCSWIIYIFFFHVGIVAWWGWAFSWLNVHMDLLQRASEWWGELFHDDHVLVWGSAACCLWWVWIIFIAITTKCLNHSFYICWLKLNLKFFFFCFVNVFIGFFFFFTFQSVVWFINVLLPYV